MKKSVLVAALFLSAAFTINAYAGFSIEGAYHAVRPDTAYNINPYNVSTVSGVGEGNLYTLLTTTGKIEIPLDYPLYRLSAGYTDKITCVDGIWGIERNVGLKIFDGSEDWSLYTKTAFKNDNTTIFQCSFGENAPRLVNGASTHFDVHTFDSQKTNRYDGISFGETTDTILMRIMNVRNVKDVDTLKTYLKTQYDNGTPVKFFYCLDEPVFTPFDDELQKELNSVKPSEVRNIDPYCLGIKYDSVTQANTNYFVNKNSGNEEMNEFLSVVKDLKIYNSDENKKFYVSGIYPDNSGVKFTINDEEGNAYSSTLSFAKADFINEKNTELEFVSDNENANEIIKMYVTLNYYHVPTENVTGDFNYESTGINPECITKEEAVLPEKVYALEGTTVDFNNSLLNCSADFGDKIEVMDDDGNIISSDGRVKTDDIESGYYYLYVNGKELGSTEIIVEDTQNNVLDNKKVMFLGDSLINENLYTQYFTEIAENEGMELLGTRGNEGSKHEGRGGWSAYDYCNVSSKYGYSNPFLNEEGKFDFGYYMKNNGYDSVDYVVVNLGINDINLSGHNSHDEILSYFDEMIESIKAYDSNIKIIWNEPLMLFDSDTTKTAKYERLSFVKSLTEHFKDSEEDGVYFCPVYMNIDSFGDFKFTISTVDEFNQDGSMKVTDTTHPNNFGYEALAKATYAFIENIAE